MRCRPIPLTVRDDRYSLAVADVRHEVDVGEHTDLRVVDYPAYGGQTVFTPSSSAQVIPTAGTVLVEDITINPIPSNYGRIEYDGSVITVS